MKLLSNFAKYLCIILISFPAIAATITDPDLFIWEERTSNEGTYYFGTMLIGEATFTVGGEQITTRAYGQEGQALSIPGPTMVMKPGFKYVLRFKNTLPFEEASPDMNVFKDPNISNLHTHGLHISGVSPGDDVGRSFAGGWGGDFVYDIPDDHMGGTYWYHAHHHGSTFLQVSAGAFGMLIIDDSGDNIPSQVSAMDEKHLVVAYLDPAVAGTGGDTLIQGNLSPTWTVNGMVGGETKIPANTWQHWRVLLADRDAREKTVSIGEGCEVALMARDGVWRTEAPKALPTRSLSLTGASRADLAVRCSSASTLNVGSTKVADITIEGTPNSLVYPFANIDGTGVWSADRPTYLRDLSAETAIGTETIRLGARTINGSKFDHTEPNFTLDPNGVQQWRLQGAANHPFHLHIYHVQVMGDCGSYEDGEYYDVIAGNCTLRFDLGSSSSVYEGKTIMHCHILQHEDQGAMGWAHITSDQHTIAKPTFPTENGMTFYEEFSFGDPPTGEVPAAPTNLSAVATSSSTIDLSWLDQSDNEDNFVVQRGDGSSFSEIATLPAGTESYGDSGLTPSTAYFYRVYAVNGTGSSAFSNEVNATTDSVGPGLELNVQSVTLSTQNAGRGFKNGVATVIITDDQGTPISGAVVNGGFNGTLNESGLSATTDASGQAVFITTDTAKRLTTLQFCVTSATGGGLSTPPGDVCGNL